MLIETWNSDNDFMLVATVLNSSLRLIIFCFTQIQYGRSKSSRMSHFRDIPPISGSIIWARQVDRQLSAYLKRVEDVLGKGWENHLEGQKLKEDGDSFR